MKMMILLRRNHRSPNQIIQVPSQMMIQLKIQIMNHPTMGFMRKNRKFKMMMKLKKSRNYRRRKKNEKKKSKYSAIKMFSSRTVKRKTASSISQLEVEKQWFLSCRCIIICVGKEKAKKSSS